MSRGFHSLPKARSFRADFFKYHQWSPPASYSATEAAYGRGREAFCVIQKTRGLFDDSLAHWQKEQKLIELLKLELGKLRSAVPETDSIALTALPIGSEQPDSKRPRLGIEATA